jgi:hypothetical protein
MSDLRRVVSRVVIVSFSVAALMGILALLSGGDFGETEIRVLLTTVIVGTESVAMLCYLASFGKRFAAVGYVGAPLSLAAAALALFLTWGGDSDDSTVKAFGVSLALAASLAQASLLLSVRRQVSAALAGTLAAVGVVALMVVGAIVQEGDVGGDGYWRLLGVVAILDVLGTVVLTATGALRRDEHEDPGPLLSPLVQTRIITAARDRGTSPDQLVSEALDAYLS